LREIIAKYPVIDIFDLVLCFVSFMQHRSMIYGNLPISSNYIFQKNKDTLI